MRAAGAAAAGAGSGRGGGGRWPGGRGGGGDLEEEGPAGGAQVLTAAPLLGWWRAERSVLAVGLAPGGHGQPEPRGLLSMLTATVTPASGSTPSDPGFMPEAALGTRLPVSGVQSGLGQQLGLLLGCR